jgi:anti-sigma B factor antagonist
MSRHTSPVNTLAPLHVQTRCTSPGMVVVAVTGEVDMATAPALHAALQDALATYTPTVVDVDLSACSFLDCSGIRVLVAVHATANAAGCQMWARYPQRLVRTVLEVANLLDVFTAHEDPAMPMPLQCPRRGRRQRLRY